MNTEMMKTLEDQLLQVLGALSLADKSDHIDHARAQLIGMIYGLRNVRRAYENQPPVLCKEDLVQIIPEKDCSDVYPGLY